MNNPDLDPARAPWIVGHRGAAGETPENTLDSLRLAAAQRVDMIELDLQLTADGHLVAAHDWDLLRMGDSPLEIESSTIEELAEIEVSGPFRCAASRRRIATLSDVFADLPESLPLNLELKRRHAPAARVVDRLAHAISARGALLVSSFDWALLEAVRRQLPDLALAPLGGRDTDPMELLAAAERLDAWSVHCRDCLADDRLLAAAAEAGRPVLVYTVNEPDAARRLFDLGVHGVFSDVPGRLRQRLSEAA